MTRARVDDVAAAIPTEGRFTIPRLMQQTSGSRVVVAKAIKRAMDAGRTSSPGSNQEAELPLHASSPH